MIIYLCSMKKLLYILIFIITSMSCERANSLSELDSILENTSLYESIFRNRVDSLKFSLSLAEHDSSRFKIAWELCEEYKVYNIDTCLIFADQMSEYAHTAHDSIIANSALVYALASVGKVDEAKEILESIPSDFEYHPELKIYYEGAHHLYFTLSQLCPQNKSAYRITRDRFRQELFKHDTVSYMARTYLFYELNTQRKHQQAKRVAQSILQMPNLPIRYRAINEYNLATTYKHLGEKELMMEHLIKSATLDLKSATKEYNSLYTLAKRLHEAGDYGRASKYMLQTLKDAIFCNYKSHYKRSAEASQGIYQMYHQEMKLKKRRQTELFVALLILLGAAVSLLIIRQVYSRRERKAIERLRISNLRLKDSNKIRDQFLSKYMEKSAYYIEKVDEIKSHMRQTYRKEGLDALLKTLRSPAFADTEFKNYFQDFDSSIIHLFPSFIDDVNKLMKPDCQFTVKKNGALCTELRILSLIRMGITESPQIAKVLNVSVYTTYCYRHRMRRDSICNGDDFEKMICEIGLQD